MNLEKEYLKRINNLIPNKNKKDIDLYHQSILLSSAYLFSIFFLFFFIALHITLQNYNEAYILIGNLIFYTILYPLYIRNGNNILFGNLIVGGGFISFLFIALFYDGIFDSVMPWFTVVSITSFLFANKKSGYTWSVLAILTILIFFLLELLGINFASQNTFVNNLFRTGASFLGSSIYLILTIFSYEYLNAKKKKILDQHKQKLEKLSIVASKTDNSIMIMDKEGDFEWVNQAFTKETGLDLEQLIKIKGRNILEANNHSEEIKNALDLVINKKIAVSFNKKITGRDNEIFYIQQTLSPVLDEDNVLNKIISIRSDISKIKEKEHKILQQNEEIIQQQEELQTTLDELEQKNNLIAHHSKELEKLSIVASQTNNAIVIMDKEGNFEWVNQAFTKETGLDLDLLIKKKGHNILEANRNSEKIKRNFDIVKNQKKATSFVKRIINRSGDTFYIQTNLTPIFDENGVLNKIISIRSNISNLKEKEQQVVFQQKELQKQRDTVLKQKEELQEIYDLVNNSINYATRIQESILSEPDKLNNWFKDNFIFFKPKDKVSGDFYWWERVDNQVVISVSDCTGHGVPGAFMSMLGISYLREIVQKEYITRPNIILRKLRKEIIKALKQKKEIGGQKDGMDMSLISIDKETNILQFSGANNPLYIITAHKLTKLDNPTIKLIDTSMFTNNNKLFYEIKPDKMPVGIYDKMDNFINHEFQLQKGDKIYMFSDGFADQFGGPRNKKFKYKAFKMLLFENSGKPMQEQKEILFSTCKSWKQDYEQVDDITILGIEI